MKELFSVGDEVIAPSFGRGVIREVIQRGRRNWNHAEYFLVRLPKLGIDHLFGPHEI